MMGVVTCDMFNRHPQLEPFLHLKPLKGENCNQDADARSTDANKPTTTASNQSSIKISSPATNISSTYQRQQWRQRMRQRQHYQHPNKNDIKHNDDDIDDLITYYGQDDCKHHQLNQQHNQNHHHDEQHHHHHNRNNDDADDNDADDDDDDDYPGNELYSTSASYASSSPPIIRGDTRRCCLRANKLAGDLYFPSDSYIEPIMVMYDDLSSSAPDFLTMTTLPSGLQQRHRQQQQQQQHYHQQQQHYLTLEELKLARQSCWLCGCNWQEDHVSLDCLECGGYALTRPCPDCDGKCKQVWKRNINGTHDQHKASWDGSCSLAPANRHCRNQQQVEAEGRHQAETDDNQGCSSGSSSSSSSSVGSDSEYGYTLNLSKLL